MDTPQSPVSRKWKREYTFLLIANFLYILIFYIIMQFYTP
jgi:hypothetical protein